MKDKYLHIKEWIEQNPKKVWKYSMIFLTLGLTISLAKDIFFPTKVTLGTKLPIFYSKSQSKEKELKNKEKKMEEIVKELIGFKEKRAKGTLTKNDSIRINFLFNQYKKIKNGY